MNCRKSILLLIALSMLAAFMACGGGSKTTTTPPPTIAIKANTGGYTSPAAVGTPFGTFSATVTSNGSPAPNVSVTFTAPTAGAGIATGTFGTSATATDTETTSSNGVATSATFTAGTVAGGPYTVTATTSGATTPATFSLTNSAGSPSTISVSSGNSQSSMVNTAFTSALAVLVVDGDGNPVNNANVTFTVTPGATGASAAFATTGATDTETTGVNGVYTTSQALTANATTGSFTVVADFTGDTGTPATFTLSNTAAASTLLTPGNYVFSVGGTDSGSAGFGASPYFVAGVFTVNGTGNTVSGGELTFSDYNYITTTPDGNLTGTITTTGISGDTNLLVTINTGDTNIGPGATTAGAGSGTLVFDVAMTPGGNGTRGLMSEYDSWASSSGELNLQTSTAAPCPAASSTTPCGYAFSVGGVNGGGAPLSVGGIIAIDGAGTISGSGSIFDVNYGGIPLNPGQTISSGTVAVLDSFGYVSIALNSSNAFFTGTAPVGMLLNGYIVDASHIRVVENWLGDNLTGTTGGTLVAQTTTGGYSSTSVSGSSYVLRAFGGSKTLSGTLQIAGVLTFQADGSVTGNMSFSDLGNISPQGGYTLAPEVTACTSGPVTTPCYSVDPTGDVTITNLTDGANFNYNLQLYLTGDGHAQVISMDTTDTLNGSGTVQKGALTFGGGYALGMGGLNSGNEVNGDGQVGVTNGTTIGGYLDENASLNAGGLNSASSLSATYTSPAAGIFDVTGSGTSLFTIYLIDATQGVIIEDDPSQLNLGYFTNQ